MISEANSWTQIKRGNPALAHRPHNALIPGSGDMFSEELKFCLLWLYLWLLVLMTLYIDEAVSTQVIIPPNCQMTHAKQSAKEPAEARELGSERCSGVGEPSFIFFSLFFISLESKPE